jgi:alpha-beta hydrolase superfamily lysophospholipase
MAGVAIFLADLITLFKGERHRSKMLATLAVGNGDKRFPGEGKNAWLTKNPENVAKYNVDEYCSYTFTCNGFRNLFCLLKNTYQKGLYRVQNPTLPIYFIAGEDDPVIVSTKAWEKAIAFLKGCGYTNVSQRLYAGLRHEILNEAESEQVMEELLVFLEK